MINAEARNGSLAWRHYDLENVWHLTTNKRITGIAMFLLKMYKTTRDKKYLEYAEDATCWIINTRIKC